MQIIVPFIIHTRVHNMHSPHLGMCDYALFSFLVDIFIFRVIICSECLQGRIKRETIFKVANRGLSFHESQYHLHFRAIPRMTFFG